MGIRAGTLSLSLSLSLSPQHNTNDELNTNFCFFFFAFNFVRLYVFRVTQIFAGVWIKPFDHGAWFAQLENPPFRGDINETFEFVLRNHPFHGRATEQPIAMQTILALPLEDAAKYTDAVAFWCLDYWWRDRPRVWRASSTSGDREFDCFKTSRWRNARQCTKVPESASNSLCCLSLKTK